MKEYKHTYIIRFQTRVNVPVGLTQEKLDEFEIALDDKGIPCDNLDKKSAFSSITPRLYLEIALMLEDEVQAILDCIENARIAVFGKNY